MGGITQSHADGPHATTPLAPRSFLAAFIKAGSTTPGLWQKAEKVVGVVEPALMKAAKKLRGGVVA